MEILQASKVTRGIIKELDDIEEDEFFLAIFLHSRDKFFGELLFKHFGGDQCIAICFPDGR